MDDGAAVSVIIPARDAAGTLERTLTALEDQELDQVFEVIVVDDGSKDETMKIARRHEPFVRLLCNEESVGPGGARNRGVSSARSPVLAFTDADCYPAPEWLARGLVALSGADLVQGRVAPDPLAPRTLFDRSLVVESEGGFYQTANLFVRRETFDSVGGFRDWALEKSADRLRRGASRKPNGEDALFAWTARRLGARSLFAEDAVVHHAVLPGGLLDRANDRWHWSRDMPGLARLVPELRRTTFHRQLFFNHVTARFDAALAGVLAARISGHRRWLLAALPYLRHLMNSSKQWGPREAAGNMLGAPLLDGVTLAGLLVGSVTWRSLVL